MREESLLLIDVRGVPLRRIVLLWVGEVEAALV
jgi:hypothetical protein